MNSPSYDVVVVGSGPAGESAVLNAAKHGKRCILIEEQSQVGGNCTHRGTIPSKALRFAIKQLIQFQRHPLLGALVDEQWISFPRILANAEQVVRTQVGMRRKFYSRNRIRVVHGRARFADQHCLQVELADGGREMVTADNFILATGSRPYRPELIDFSHPRVYDSDTILRMQHTPRKIIIYGAGIIGCEYASILCGLGIKVELVNTRQRLLEFLDDEISDALSYHLRTLGVMVRHREELVGLDATDRGVTLNLCSGKALHADALLFCNGRSGNTEALGLDMLGLAADSRGLLAVNQQYQTDLPHVFGVGDVIGWPSLASAAYNQGLMAAAVACGSPRHGAVEAVATGIYTLPEISAVGHTERELTESRRPYEVGRAFFKDTARAQISGEVVGMLKLLFDPDSLALLGIHCFGAEATEIVHIGQAIMDQPEPGNRIDYFVKTTFNYPTMAEAYRIAALNGLNRLDSDNVL